MKNHMGGNMWKRRNQIQMDSKIVIYYSGEKLNILLWDKNHKIVILNKQH